MYEQAAQEAQAAQQAEGATETQADASKDDDVVDGDYTEV